MLIVSKCFVTAHNYHKLSVLVIIVIIVNSHEVMWSVNYVELSITRLQCCFAFAVVNFAAFHTNCYELTKKFTSYLLWIKCNCKQLLQLLWNSHRSFVFERVLTRDSKWGKGDHLLLPWLLLIICVTLLIEVSHLFTPVTYLTTAYTYITTFFNLFYDIYIHSLVFYLNLSNILIQLSPSREEPLKNNRVSWIQK